MTYTEKEILRELDLAFQGKPGAHYPSAGEGDVHHNFFLDLEHGYFSTAGSRIHLYADKNHWAVIQEKNGYHNRGGRVEIELNYLGNCVGYVADVYPERTYVSNTKTITLVSGEELSRVENRTGEEAEHFELIGPAVETILVGDRAIPIELSPAAFEDVSITLRSKDNPRGLIGFEDLPRYWSAVRPELVFATEADLRSQLPAALPKLMTIGAFHHASVYEPSNLPSRTETYQLIAKVLAGQDAALWQPTLPANNHWSNWESGHL